MPFPTAARSAGSGTNRVLALLTIGLLAAASTSSAAAPTKTKKRPVTTETETPVETPKKKARPADDSPTAKDKDNAPGDEKTATRPKTPRATPAPTKTKEPPVESDVSPNAKSATVAPNASLTPEELLEYRAQPASVRALIDSSLALARQNLTYTFGSADPANGGMDCSGFIYFALRQHGLTQVPRDSSGLYVWARKAHGFRAVISRKPDSFEMDEMLPGDLLFWIGTYATDHDPPVSHTMIYLGTEKATGAKVMVGSSDGRAYRGQKRKGVSVFDFVMPRTPAGEDQRSTFIGYARIPGLRD